LIEQTGIDAQMPLSPAPVSDGMRSPLLHGFSRVSATGRTTFDVLSMNESSCEIPLTPAALQCLAWSDFAVALLRKNRR
jgi:hypothetical protein